MINQLNDLNLTQYYIIGTRSKQVCFKFSTLVKTLPHVVNLISFIPISGNESLYTVSK